jgi:hypothetical protein
MKALNQSLMPVIIFVLLVTAGFVGRIDAAVHNLHLVTDNVPDYTDIESFGGMCYLSSAQIAFIVSSWPKPVGTALEELLAQYQFLFPTASAKVLLPGIWR